MKTKNSIFTGIIAITVAMFIIAGCKKKEEPVPTTPPVVSPTDSTSQTTRVSDQSNVEDESNIAMDEANSAMSDVSTTRDIQAYCGMIIDSSAADSGKITLKYNGLDCSGTKMRTGWIVIQLPYTYPNVTRWSTPGAKAELTFINYKVAYVSNNKSLTFNGSHTVTDSTGYDYSFYFGTPIVYKIRANVQLTFEDGSTLSWKSARRRKFTYLNSIASVSESGDTTLNGYSKVAFWGTNRIGDSFTIVIPNPVSYNVFGNGTTCFYKPRGEVKYYWLTHELTLSYGVSSNGSYPDASPCPWGYKFSWTDGQSVDHSIKVQYY